jgi:hypothetical protein
MVPYRNSRHYKEAVSSVRKDTHLSITRYEEGNEETDNVQQVF